MDRSAITSFVEDYWRTLIPAMQTGGASAFSEVADRFEERVKQVAATMEPLAAASFTQQVESERERLMSEYKSNPVALKKRLGIGMGIDATPRYAGPSTNSLGNLAVRTVVRATIWESIWSIFRAFR